MVVLGLKNLWACLSWLFIYLLRCNWNHIIFISGLEHDDACVYHWIVTTVSLINLSPRSSFFKGAVLRLACGWGIPSLQGCCSGFACSCSWCLISACVLSSDHTGCYDGKILRDLPVRVARSLGCAKGRWWLRQGLGSLACLGLSPALPGPEIPSCCQYPPIRPVALTGGRFCCLTFTLYQLSSNLNTSFSLVLRNPVRTRVWYIIIYFSVTG